jgi:site-specific DNA recombinase
MMNKNSAVIYVRVSTKGQETEGESIPVQIKNCTDYAEKLGQIKPKVFKETYSGMKPDKRPQFSAMLKYLRENRPGHLIFLRPDRLGRHPSDPLKLQLQCQETNHHLVLHDLSSKKSFDIIDPRAQADWLRLVIKTSEGGVQVLTTMEGVEESIKKILSEGHFPGYAPVGYRNIVGRRKIVIDEERAPYVIKAFNLFATGDYSLDDVWERIRAEGLTVRTPRREERDMVPCRPISRSDLWRMLKNPFYYGQFYWGKDGTLWDNRGITKKGPRTYPPLITKDLFDKVQEIFAKNRGQRMIRSGKPFLYRGLLECRYCGCTLVGEGKLNGPYIYYRCTYGKRSADPDYYMKRFGQKNCPQKYWREEEITQVVQQALADMDFDQAIFDMLREQVTGEIAERRVATGDELTFLRKQKAELDDEKMRYLKIKWAGKAETDELKDLDRAINETKAKLDKIMARIGEIESLSDNFVEDGLATLETAHDFLNLFKNKTLSKPGPGSDDDRAQKKIMLKTIFRNMVAGDSLPHPKFGKPLQGKTYNGIEFVWNEPFNWLWETKLIEQIRKDAKDWEAEHGDEFRLPNKKWRGRRDSNSRPPA